MAAWAGIQPTPNIDRLAQRGLLFTNGHVPAPVCNPCRTSVLTGRSPGSTGIYANDVVWHEAFPEITSLPGHFKANGYRVVGGGKVNHHTPGFNRRSDWHDYFDQVFDSHYQDQLARGLNVTEFQWPNGFPLNQIEAVRSFSKPPQNAREFDWGPFDTADHEMGMARCSSGPSSFLPQLQSNPFFLAAGIYRPHLPFYAPRKYFEMYPLDQIVSPKIKPDDCVYDLPKGGQAMVLPTAAATTNWSFERGSIVHCYKATWRESAYADGWSVSCWTPWMQAPARATQSSCCGRIMGPASGNNICTSLLCGSDRHMFD